MSYFDNNYETPQEQSARESWEQHEMDEREQIANRLEETSDDAFKYQALGAAFSELQHDLKYICAAVDAHSFPADPAHLELLPVLQNAAKALRQIRGIK